MSYKKVGIVTPQHNKEENLLQRQFAAHEYIGFLTENKRIINIDESVLRLTDHRNRGWVASRAKNFQSHAQRLV